MKLFNVNVKSKTEPPEVIFIQNIDVERKKGKNESKNERKNEVKSCSKKGTIDISLTDDEGDGCDRGEECNTDGEDTDSNEEVETEIDF